MVTKDTYKDMIESLIRSEKELMDFAKECLKRIYGQDYEYALRVFKDDWESWEFSHGCLRGLKLIDHDLKLRNEALARYESSQDEEKKESGVED